MELPRRLGAQPEPGPGLPAAQLLPRLLAVVWSGRAMGWWPRWPSQGWGAAGGIVVGSGCKPAAVTSSPSWAG